MPTQAYKEGVGCLATLACFFVDFIVKFAHPGVFPAWYMFILSIALYTVIRMSYLRKRE